MSTTERIINIIKNIQEKFRGANDMISSQSINIVGLNKEIENIDRKVEGLQDEISDVHSEWVEKYNELKDEIQRFGIDNSTMRRKLAERVSELNSKIDLTLNKTTRLRKRSEKLKNWFEKYGYLVHFDDDLSVFDDEENI